MGSDLFGHTYSEEHLRQMMKSHDQQPFYDIETSWMDDFNDPRQLTFDFEKEIGVDMQQKVDKLSKMSYNVDMLVNKTRRYK
tara:strand:- start:293 stop:538 length:246 start_codon:yes stop_codon:yes gene_type:complete